MASLQLNIRYKANKEADPLQAPFQVDPASKVGELATQAVELWQLEAAGLKYYLSKGKLYLPPSQQLSTLVEMGKLQSGDTVTMTHRLATAEARQQRPVTNTAQHAATRRAVVASKEETIDHVVQVQNQVSTLDNKADILVAAAYGETPARGPGQTDAQRLKQLRLAKRIMDNEIQDLVERETDRKATKKRDALAGRGGQWFCCSPVW